MDFTKFDKEDIRLITFVSATIVTLGTFVWRWRAENKRADAAVKLAKTTAHTEYWGKLEALIKEFISNSSESRLGTIQGIALLAKSMERGSDDNKALLDRVCGLLTNEKLRPTPPADQGALIDDLSALIRIVTTPVVSGKDRRNKIQKANNSYRAQLENVKLPFGCDLSRRDFVAAVLVAAEFEGCILRESRLDQADLRDAMLIKCNFRGASLRNSNLHGATLTGSDFTGAKMMGANLRSVNEKVKEAPEETAEEVGEKAGELNLTKADLRNANLAKADFTGANLEGADLRNAVLVDVNFKNARLCGAIWNDDDMVLASWREAEMEPDRRAILELHEKDLRIKYVSKHTLLSRFWAH